MCKDNYQAQIIQLLDQAAGDKQLSTEEYRDLCEQVAGNATDRAQAAQDDLYAEFREPGE